ncbi:putative ATP-grasp-modified RiPP [Streptomyces sp. NPDC001373]|uniref:putative ATP-grasp-modified RiPP n=1 Tax=Streptomyces sp. NPDC001373 TaxID=3364565 RepID=UPI003681AA7B
MGHQPSHPYTTAVQLPHASVTIDPATQLGVFRDRHGNVVEMGKHGTSSGTGTTTSTSPDDARFAAAQTRYGLGGVLHSLGRPLWVNHPLRNAAADYKPHQLALAQHLDIAVPDTLITNDPDEARGFIATHPGVIHKTLRATSYQRDGVPVVSWAEPVTAEEIDDRIHVVPHLFQVRVDKAYDIRVLVVGHEIFAVRINSDLLDWRRDYAALTYSVISLPARLEKALLAFLDSFGLASGSFDLAVDRNGTHWLLELNPNGQWGWLEEHTGLPLASAVAGLLTQGGTT